MTRHISLRHGLGAIGVLAALTAAIAPTALATTPPPTEPVGSEPAATEVAPSAPAASPAASEAATSAPAASEAAGPAASEAPAASGAAAPAPAVDMDALVAAANEEGQVNLIALPPTWANYEGVIAGFNEKYPDIETPVQQPGASSAEELVAVETQRGQDTMPDVLDVSPAIAQQATEEAIWDPYMPSTWDEVPETLRDPLGNWVAAYYGVMAFGVNTTLFTGDVPQSFADLANAGPGQVSINGDPREAGAAFAAVMAASLANGGSFDDIMPGIQYFADLADAGILSTVAVSEQTVLSGEVTIAIDWSYNFPGLIPQVVDAGFEYATAFPTDSIYASYYCQGVVAGAPNPNAGRLWIEHILSDEGALAYLEGGAIPARYATMVEAGTITDDMLANLPPAELIEGVAFPNAEQIAAAQDALVENWGPMVLGE